MTPSAQPVPSDIRPRLIKRYANRKLYDTVLRKFTSLPKIERLVRDGVEVRVEQNDTGEDVTAQVLGRVLERGSSELPLATLIRMPGQVARAVTRDTSDRREIDEMKAQIQALTTLVESLMSRDDPDEEGVR